MSTERREAASQFEQTNRLNATRPPGAGSDERIAREVRSRLEQDYRVGPTDIEILPQDGRVRLSGIVDCLARKLAIGEAVKGVSGVVGVENDIEVLIPDDLHRSDVDTAWAVRRALESGVVCPGCRIRSTVCDGWVTLEGVVDRAESRDEAARAVGAVAGVTGISNDIVVEES